MDDVKLSVKQISRLSHWLQLQGMTAEQILNCIDYIARSESETAKKKSEPSAATNLEGSDKPKND